MPERSSLDRTYFDTLYAEKADPWDFRTSPYEQRKYAATLDALSRSRYARALEVGCSIGVLTRLLAGRCDRLLSVDTSARALAEAERDCADLDQVTFRLASLPEDFPDGTFDLIMLSEVLYYLSRTDLVRVATQCGESLTTDGEILLCHWLGETNYPLTGDEAAEGFVSAMASRFRVVKQWREPEYRLDLLARTN